jgi:uncharacterized membrane protein
VAVHHRLRRLVAWIAVNLTVLTRAWDPYPFILLNLVLSMLAAVQPPIITMSQNRQDAKDRLRGELDFAVNRKAETEITQLAAKLNRIEDRLDDLQEALSRRERRSWVAVRKLFERRIVLLTHRLDETAAAETAAAAAASVRRR